MKKLRIMLLSSIFALPACESNPYKLTASLPSPIIVADSDKDGVSDDKDRCPNTPLNVAVILENGCPTAPEVIIVNVINYKALFARNSYYPNHDNYYDKLGNIAKKLQENTPLSTLYNSLILKGLKFNNFLAKNCKPSIYRALEKRVESQVRKSKILPLT